MVEEAHRPRLGRGLAALIGDAGDEPEGAGKGRAQKRVPIEFLKPNPNNPRRQFESNELEELADSIRERGVLQPILVRAVQGLADAYEIIAGERRWRASQRAGLHELPVVIVEASDRDAMEIAIIENVQRSDLNALEEAAGYERLMTDHGYSQNDMAKVIGKSRSHVGNTLRLLKLPLAVREAVERGDLSAGHARALLSVSDPERIALKAISEGLSVRDVERLSQEPHTASVTRKSRPKPPKDPDTAAVEKALEDVLGLIVTIDHRGDGGEMRIKYKTLEQLDGLCRRLKN
ncbi:MAG: ParB/RepB/Spo0J family partition protein [Beijerinckiaceae bacterium]